LGIDISCEINYNLVERFLKIKPTFLKSRKDVVPEEKSRPSLLDVARHAGVSPATVSRVLNNTAHVRANVRDRVLVSVKALGYEVSSSSSHKILLRQNAIALIIPDVLNPYFTEIVRGIQDEAGGDKLLPLLLDTAEDPQREMEVLRMLASQPICGIIACGSRIPLDDLAALWSHFDMPLVLINRTLRMPNVACIKVDLKNATYRATRHLLDLHHTHIAYLSGPSKSESSLARREGIEAALAEASLPLRPEWCPVSFPDVDGGFQAMSALLALPHDDLPTAVITYNDLMALGALHAIRANYLHVPEDISVIGNDNISMAAHANPPLTTLSAPTHRMGRMAMQMLRRMIEGHPPPEEGYTLMECPLIVRESTAPAPNGVQL
jgi:LacI family repressor for deo operon, udp, cdd, tsx, nupC, and nupG